MTSAHDGQGKRSAPRVAALCPEEVSEQLGTYPDRPILAHCAFCTRPIRRGRRQMRFCSGRCRAADWKRRTVSASVRDSLERMLRDPNFAEQLPIDIVPAFVDALDVLRRRLRDRLGHDPHAGIAP